MADHDLTQPPAGVYVPSITTDNTRIPPITSLTALSEENQQLREQVDQLKERNRGLEEKASELDRLKAAMKVEMPEFILDGNLRDQQTNYIVWLERKVEQLQGREQLSHELGKSYAEPKLENRQLREQLAQLRGERALWHSLKADTCRCGHSLIAHRGHGHAIGSPEPLHCSTLCGCGRFDPPALMEVLQAREREAGFWKGAVKNQPEQRGGFCLFCNNGDGAVALREGGSHSPDCPWVKAQPTPDPGDPGSSHSA